MTRKQKRLAGIGIIGVVIALAAFLVTTALRDEIVFFYDPSEVLAGEKVQPGQNFRLGGLVKEDSVDRESSVISFIITDGDASIPVTFDGLLPDLFREGQGVIAEGTLEASGTFVATNILAKHDENYIPRELEGVLKEKNVWQGDEAQ